MTNGFCAFTQKHQILTILFFALLGVGLGVGLSFWEPANADSDTKKITLQWIGLIGDLFLRSLKCFVLPLVFVNVIISVVDMMTIGKASSIGWTVIGLYLFTTVAAAFFGSISTLMFMGLYNTEEIDATAVDSTPYVQLECGDEGSFLGEDESGTVSCSANNTGSNFMIYDINGVFATNNKAEGVAQVSLSDTIYNGIFTKIVPDNVIGAFAGNNFAAVIFFAIIFGAALSPLVQKGKGKIDYHLMAIFSESDNVFQRIIRWIIMLTPYAVCSLIAEAIGDQDDLPSLFANIGLLMASAMTAWIFQLVFVYIGLFAVLTKSNPIQYLKHIVPAQIFAFACASSAATIPISLAAVKSTGRVPDTIGRFVIPLGATVNMDGGAVYFVCACIWLAVLNGEDVTIASFLLLIIIATVGSIGTAPVPSASLVLIITAYNTVFNTTGTPNGFGYILAIDWFMDRCRTATNITGDCVVAGIVAHRCPIEDITNNGDIEDIMYNGNDNDNDEKNTNTSSDNKKEMAIDNKMENDDDSEEENA
jgi:Na+/H+-dicarboxylate symporter